MALVDDVKAICGRLAPLGWREVFAAHGLDLTAANLSNELLRPLTVDRTRAGFEDFCTAGVRAIEPGRPERSLFYHGLASPAVQSSSNPGAYPTVGELDTIENYIYSLAKRRLQDFTNPVIAVFACQYRTGSRSPHGQHADMAYSRTGVARVGTAAANYDRRRRSFRVEPENGSAGIAVMPARYAAYIAESRRPAPDDGILQRQASDSSRQFLFPLHKLFPGDECLVGLTVTVDFAEFHINEKLRRVHTVGGIGVIPGFDVNAAPFVRDSKTTGDLVQLEAAGASVLATPIPQARLVRTVKQRNTATNRDEVVRFRVPPEPGFTRFWTSLELPALEGRNSPEYLHMRQRVKTTAGGTQTLDDLNRLSKAQFDQLMAQGGYDAAHFTDDSCDGCVTARVGGLGATLPNRPAYSLVTAPDFFPLCDQLEIQRWVNSSVPSLGDHFAQGGPKPLCEDRNPPNLGLARPEGSGRAFTRAENTIAAMVSAAPPAGTAQAPPKPNLATSWLPDAASGVFAPGWDVARAGDAQGPFLAAYGLGSPFPEDAKLCAALNSFWPAVAPDTSRTFGGRSGTTAMPLLDAELGLHPKHPKVAAGQVVSQPGWDGEFGPFFEVVAGVVHANYANRFRSDYVLSALNGLMSVQGLAQVDADELIRRMKALRACVRILPPANDVVSETGLLLVSAEKVPDWAARADRGNTSLAGPGYLYLFATIEGAERAIPGDLRRTRSRVDTQYICQIVDSALCFRVQPKNQNPTPFQLVAIPSIGVPAAAAPAHT